VQINFVITVKFPSAASQPHEGVLKSGLKLLCIIILGLTCRRIVSISLHCLYDTLVLDFRDVLEIVSGDSQTGSQFL